MESKDKIKKVQTIAWITGAFTALVSLLMLLNYLQIRGSEPLESSVLKLLVERLSAEPDNAELAAEIRQLDLLARRAYFSSLWQIRTGAVLLLLGGIAFVAALLTLHNLRFKIEKPNGASIAERLKRDKNQQWIIASGAILFGLAALSAFLTEDHISKFEVYRHTAQAVAPDDRIERVTIQRSETAEIADGDELPDEVEVEVEETSTDVIEPEEIAEEAETTAQPEHQLLRSDVERNFNAFRGPWGNAVSNHSNIPVDWDGKSGKNIRWKTRIPVHGYNSPVLWGDYLFLSSADKDQRLVYALNRHTGEILWERAADQIPGSPAVPPRTTDDTGLAAPSVTVDGKRVFAIFGTGDIIAFDFAGNRLWARNLGVPDNHYGHSSSLLTWNNMVFVQYDTQSGSKVMALDVATGNTVWEKRRTSQVSWASPILAEVDGSFQLILLGHPDFSAYDIHTGEQLWSVDVMSGEVGVSPVFGGGLVFAANEYATMVAVDPRTGEIKWQDRYYLPEVSSPVYHDGLLYIATTFAVLASFDAQTGDFIWEFDAEDIFYSSPMIADGKLYVFDTSGRAYIFRPGREPELIATPELGERVYATPVFANGRIYIRGNEHVFSIGVD